MSKIKAWVNWEDGKHHKTGTEVLIDVHSSTVEANGWVETGDWHSAMFWIGMEEADEIGIDRHASGRSQQDVELALIDLKARSGARNLAIALPAPAEAGLPQTPGVLLI